MPLPKSKTNTNGLGRAIINRKVKDHRTAVESGRYTTELENPNRLQSITQERDLDAFLSAASLANTDFTAERRNVHVVAVTPNASHHTQLLSAEEEAQTLRKFAENKQRLRVPRRAPWNKTMTKQALDRQEKDAFIEWRRGLADLQDKDKFLLTPFERNIEVWRQLWRVIERSHLVVQIVDARNPLRFRCEDLESYVQDVEGVEGEQGTGRGLRKSLLLINKADLLTTEQRRLWADYFDSQGLRYAFFSALNAAALQEARREALEAAQLAKELEQAKQSREEGQEDGNDDDDDDNEEEEAEADAQAEHQTTSSSEEDESENDSVRFDLGDSEDDTDPRVRVLSVLELEDLFKSAAPELASFAINGSNAPNKLVVGLVGYPNVGKSSTINTLLGEKKVSVSSTPGKTKHFQTIHLSDDIVLCDCPGLVFPQFATTKADLVCDGVLPIDQLREYTGPAALLVKRIPKDVLEATYGLTIRTRPAEEGGDGRVLPENLLIPYAIARGFMRAGQGNPDEARAARYILKDYVNAKLLFCHSPPGQDEDAFNARTREILLQHAAKKKRAPVTRVGLKSDTFVLSADSANQQAQGGGPKGSAFDREFFEIQSNLASRPFIQGSAQDGMEFSRSRLYPHQNMMSDDGSAFTGRRARIAAVLTSAGANGLGGADKKHKKMKKVKQRSGRGYDD